MKSITVHRLSLQFDADQITHGTHEEQAAQAIALINTVLQREPFGLAAQLIDTRDEIEVEFGPEPMARRVGASVVSPVKASVSFLAQVLLSGGVNADDVTVGDE